MKAAIITNLLNHSICPTILVEIGFVSNPMDRMRMTDSSQQIQIANAMSAAIDTYFLLLNQTLSKETSCKGSDLYD
ncbi:MULTISPECIES: N-acetylmuramoyl-L-alanine amidase family protein [Aneurinibacillus]|uniref:N-acetylmuramoyl-L-alanine amidase n=1 Tax=Aneurinibacillus thermoaerophilus TaxID=143495 RepID=A0A1G8EDB5_ANETH|nr:MULTISPECIES: N-acetylmuramoyl-L-alanine amidase [Aneurinibacillus]AMA72386.1 hypothetical protein ACH33_05665 [Aneurinibacillus sp. XH2]MED0676331.1 N-acetylmuramoyl-L-alanine amidase [Aneurinibacillus thermoaerophilus]MED0679848.1 N-acetylmuramoyl-L-alanine amidase [Aneurinibacillus thermoaerophilus]MED0737904.1 N-acetylmuramoyl-L-alanine amidase [Aneurinibacillus thermoaerophilus]MED0758864.1 N-acetylmuramoyl-L-alanine amidase [Aneurinibacillus thermoaerophilus]